MLIAPEKLIAAIDRFLASKPNGSQIAAAPAHWHAIARLLPACRARIDADSAWPSISEELARKALTAVHDATHAYSVGLITKDALIQAVVAVIDTTSGLIPSSDLDTINTVLKELRK